MLFCISNEFYSVVENDSYYENDQSLILLEALKIPHHLVQLAIRYELPKAHTALS
jgi:hypothetical protein